MLPFPPLSIQNKIPHPAQFASMGLPSDPAASALPDVLPAAFKHARRGRGQALAPSFAQGLVTDILGDTPQAPRRATDVIQTPAAPDGNSSASVNDQREQRSYHYAIGPPYWPQTAIVRHVTSSG